MQKVNVVKNVLGANDLVAEKNRETFKQANILSVNLISSPGSGKTTLLVKTMAALQPEQKSIAIVGDLKTTRDADRLSETAWESIQINTGMSCHLYANQIAQSIDNVALAQAEFLFIENVGNMVCPGEFDLGENLKVILLSLPEGDDKVAKYPTIFRAADIVLLTKTDLKGVLDFDIERVRKEIAKLNEKVTLLEISSTTGEGMEDWVAWLRAQRGRCVGTKAKFFTEEE